VHRPSVLGIDGEGDPRVRHGATKAQSYAMCETLTSHTLADGPAVRSEQDAVDNRDGGVRAKITALTIELHQFVVLVDRRGGVAVEHEPAVAEEEHAPAHRLDGVNGVTHDHRGRARSLEIRDPVTALQ